MKTNSQLVVDLLPGTGVAVGQGEPLQVAAPRAAATSVLRRTSTLSASRMRWTR